MVLRSLSRALRPAVVQVTGQRRCGRAAVGAMVVAARGVHGSLAARGVAVPVEAAAAENAYVSPHDWKQLTEGYGKPVDAGAVRTVEVQTIALNSRPETDQGSRYSRKLREQGLLPGVLYGKGTDADQRRVLVTVSRLEIEKQMRRLRDSLESTVFEVEVDGTYKQRVILRDLDRVPATGVPRSINFLRYRPGYPVKVPVCYVNHELCIPLKRGGMLLGINHFIPVTCEGDTIPEMLIVDLADAQGSEKIGMSRVLLPPGVKPYRLRPEFFLSVVKGKGSVEAAAAAAEGGREEEAA